MLSDEEKQRIREEEEYRLATRRSLENNKSLGAKIWVVFNANFVLFVLSSVVVGGLTLWYQESRKDFERAERKAQKQEQDRQTASKLTEEAIARLDVIIRLQDTIPEFASKNILVAFWGSSIRFDKSLNLRYYNVKPLFSAYERWTLIELLTELNKYTYKFQDSLVLQCRDLLIRKADRLNGGYHLYTRSASRRRYPPGNLLKNGEYVTKSGDKFQIHRKELPLTKYYTGRPGQQAITRMLERLRKKLAADGIDAQSGP